MCIRDSGDLEALARSLDSPDSLPPATTDTLRRAVDAAVDYVHLGAAGAAALALLVLLILAPRRFPVLGEGTGREE